ncbi:DNA mismatch repair endonuclease MutL [Fimbriimonas ginsengisoli]|uniref:DNA mismatch repair protein MutL n=1 Tax=Fimbriimonas ginsengisoli Gsoil 348 TaxID=661478 RepID=A0A068NIY1_FIMGI|nr:DNA mismatch repair endonuclease MutL [Fimbriimonas ginsengisoli]AIE83476.1 DNA mismatch repair protein MutL [Fimbriimonas ginsengisoli Gsoil 348]
MPLVHLLDPHTVNQIAAGEVVERPASVVKELVENALDAGATRIEVELIASGKTLIRVSDNGIGMSLDDARQALERHATSKITSVDDLQAVRTLGFRGEALPSIASVSRLSISTASQDGLRSVLAVEGGEVRDPAGAAGPKGTEVRVEDLFYNTPARLKFLKSDTTELGQAMDHVSRYAIAYPQVAFTLTHNGQLAIRTSGSGEMLEAISDVWGREVARTLAEVRMEVAGLRLSGFVSPPHVTKPTRAYQYLFVNGRPVRTRTLTVAVDQAFRDLTPERRYPMLVLLIDVDPARIDVNVSPTKSEVKFQQEGAAFDAIRISLKSALMEHGMMPDAAGVAAANEALRQIRQSQTVEDWRTHREPTHALFGDLSLLAQSPLPGPDAEPRLEPAPSDPPPSTFPPPPLGAPPSNLPFLSLLDELRVIGQAMKTFIIAETRHGVVIIDQHVAHERIIYEYLCGLKGPTAIEKQRLLVPQTLHLDRRSAVLLREKVDELSAVGFELEPFGGESYVVRAVPAAIRNKDPLQILKDLVDELVETAVTRKLVPTREQIWIMSSCKMAVKAGDPLSIAEMEKLIADLATTENPYLCPHGRPITVTLGKDALLRMFKRT